MTERSEALPRAAFDAPIILAVYAAHFVSHYYIIILPPLFDVIRGDYGVSYTEIGLALTAFNVVTATGQTPAGFLVDRFGPRIPLIGGLLLGAVGFALAGLVHSFWFFIAMFALAGLGNTVYHPANYAMLSHYVPPERISRAFSLHIFAGMLGGAVAPAILLTMQSLWGWRGAFIGSALPGLVLAGVLMLLREPPRQAVAKPKTEDGAPVGWRLLLSGPILLNLVFFMLFAVASSGLQNYSVVALGALHGLEPAATTTALTSYLLLSAVGVLAGGVVAGRTSRHGLVTGIGFTFFGLLAVMLTIRGLGETLIIAAMGLAGFFFGLTMPSRDMILRAITPPGSFGKVFGFVTSGFNIGGIIAPLVFGLAMDHGEPRWVFLMVALFSLGVIAAIYPASRKPGSAGLS